MEFSRDIDTDLDNEINSSNNNKIYEPVDINEIILNETQVIANKLNHEIEELSIIGDIINFKKWRSAGCGFDLTLNESKLKCKVWIHNGLEPNDVEEYVNNRCIITGNLIVDSYYETKICINVNSIRLISNDTKLKELKSICKTKGYFENKKKVEWNNIKKIGIISKQNTQGYDDFYNQFKVPLFITLLSISLEGVKTSRECGEAIKNLQNTDLIIIIRGGGDTGEISNSFDVIELFDIIKKSNIPIATAIGHEQDKGDKLLITNVADIDFPTPTACAKNLNNKFYNLLIDKLDDFLNSNEELFHDLLEENNKKLYKDLKCYLEYFIKNKFGGRIIKLDNDETNIIIEKNGKYYKNNLNFDIELKLKKEDICLINDIEIALEEEDINTIKENFNKINTNKDKLSIDIQNNIKAIEKNEKIKDKFSDTNASKITQYYLKQISKTNNLNNLIKIRKLLLWYKEQIEESMYGKDIDEIKDIYNFIKNL
tara:strand:+ start:1970 stop:3424 length:1455 start_codon:yes stop_codon:yes gene_type:complete